MLIISTWPHRLTTHTYTTFIFYSCKPFSGSETLTPTTHTHTHTHTHTNTHTHTHTQTHTHTHTPHTHTHTHTQHVMYMTSMPELQRVADSSRLLPVLKMVPIHAAHRNCTAVLTHMYAPNSPYICGFLSTGT